jgi:hypothetical protein
MCYTTQALNNRIIITNEDMYRMKMKTFMTPESQIIQ